MPGPPLIVLGTGNAGKVAEFRRLLQGQPWRIAPLTDFPAAAPPPENGPSLRDNSRQKAVRLARQLQQWVLADDTGLLVDALGGRPGVHTSRYAGPQATAQDNRRLLLNELAETPPEQRTAQFVCHLTLADPLGRVRLETTGNCRGLIRQHEAGSGGFGYDCLLEIVEYHRTLAELGDAVAACISHRAQAVQAMLPLLRQLLAWGDRLAGGFGVGR